jgi:hypothetical protein
MRSGLQRAVTKEGKMPQSSAEYNIGLYGFIELIIG